MFLHVIASADFREHNADISRLDRPMQRVSDILSHKGGEVFSISHKSSVYDAIALMAHKGVGALLVNQDGRPVGIISERDYTRNVILKDKSSKLTKVADIMTRNLVTVTSHEHADRCIALMKQYHIRHLPVCDDNVIVGMLSSRDLFSAVIDDQSHVIDELEHYVRGEL